MNDASADNWAYALVLLAVVPANLFPLLYGTSVTWWRSFTGRALMTSAIGMALLIDISVLYRFLGEDYPFRDTIRLTVYALVVAGSWMKLGAFLVQRRDGNRDRRRERERVARTLDP